MAAEFLDESCVGPRHSDKRTGAPTRPPRPCSECESRERLLPRAPKVPGGGQHRRAGRARNRARQNLAQRPFDTMQPAYKRVLFVAHREEILDQACETFRKARPNAQLGLYTGRTKAPDADVVFASIQTLGRQNHLLRFAPEAFDYIVVDEFHHAAANTYRRLLNHFTPKFLLGLTATPERTDGGDLLALLPGEPRLQLWHS